MFSFHKPKIYRSLKGCCICRAKSSSSRFTDSKRYEQDFEKCFKTMELRCGEICNACVLLVKRWKKLPVGSNRNWHHVVDARAGPGTKSIMRMKSKNKEEKMRVKKKHKHRKPISHKHKSPHSPGGLSDDVILGDDCSEGSSHPSSPLNSDCSDDEQIGRKGRSKGRRKKSNPVRFSSFLDLTYWKKTEICCGIIFKGASGEVLVDTKLLHPCRTCKPAPSSGGNSSSGGLTPTHEAASTMLALPTPPQDTSQDSAAQDMITADQVSQDSQDSIIDPMDTTVTMTPASTVPSTPTSSMPSVPSSPTRAAIEAVLDLSLPVLAQKGPAARLEQSMCIQMEV